MQYIDHFLCYCERAKQCLISEGIEENKITVIPLGVDLNKFKPLTTSQVVSSKTKAKKSDRVKILFTGRNVPEKGYKEINSLIKHLIKEFPLELLIAKDVAYEKMSSLYQRANIFVMPSKTTKTWEEQYGMSLVEAMASGLAIVAYHSGSIPELLGNAGILVQEGNVRELGIQIQNLCNNPSFRSKLGTMARRRAERYFDSVKVKQRIEKFYETQYRNINA